MAQRNLRVFQVVYTPKVRCSLSHIPLSISAVFSEKQCLSCSFSCNEYYILNIFIYENSGNKLNNKLSCFETSLTAWGRVGLTLTSSVKKSFLVENQSS